jgi:hypothetical protein
VADAAAPISPVGGPVLSAANEATPAALVAPDR